MVHALQLDPTCNGVMDIARSRIGRVLLWPVVTQQINGLFEKRRNRYGAYCDDNAEPRTVSYVQLKTVIISGVLIDCHPITEPAPGWIATIKGGSDSVGDPFVVFIRVLKDRDSPLEITGFEIPQP